MESNKVKDANHDPAVTLTTEDTDEGDKLKHLDIDPYNEDETELRFLHSKPSCFVIIGKPGSGKTSLAHRLTAEWRCECINPTDLISQHIELQTEQGKKCLEILLRGEAVPEDVVAQLIEEKVNSQEVAHHGYVLDGFPSQCESYLSIKDQLELVKTWKLKPDFIINIKIPDKDLEVRRCNQKVDSITGDIYTKDVYAPEKPEKTDKKSSEEEEEEMEEEEEEEIEDFLKEAEEAIPELTPDILERLVTRPEDLLFQVVDAIQNYKNNVLRIFEDYMADHDQQYLIELDGNQTLGVLFKQLTSRLSCFVLRPAAVPLRLIDPEDEDISEEAETDELMRLFGARQMVAPRFRWRRSRWLRNCPVALHEGNVIPGKPEFGVGFLDKMYFLSSADALDKFLKNPRPYLFPPQPRPPCKISVIGPPLSGKTSLSHLLAQKYGATVLDMDKLIEPRTAEQKKANLEEVRLSTIETAIQTVKAKIKERLDAEAAAKEAVEAAKSEETEGDGSEEGAEETEEGVEDKGDNLEKVEEHVEEEDTTTEDKDAESSTDTEGVRKPEVAEPEKVEELTKPSPLEAVDAAHPDVLAIMETAVEEASKYPVTLTPEILLKILEEAIEAKEAEIRKEKKDGPLHGGWILDNFPNSREQWNALIEKGFLPDEVVCLRDNSDQGSYLTKRWYLQSKEEIDEKVRVRLESEERERIRVAEEEKRKEEEDRRATAEVARIVAEEERQRRIDAGEDLSEEDDTERDGEEENEAEAEKDKHEAETEAVPEEEKVFEASSTSLLNQDEVKVPEGPEVEVFREKRKVFDKEFPTVQATIVGSTGIEPIVIDIEERKEENLLEESVNNIERQFNYQGWEYSGIDVDEEDEDMEADQEAEEEEEGMEEEEDPNRSRKKPLGDTNHFCPVALTESGVLYPGNPEIAARYREKVYYLSTAEAREKFLANPKTFLPPDGPKTAPPARFLILGPRGAGKSLHGRHLAKKMGIFHISFKEKLQELIIAKTKKKIGPEYSDDVEEADGTEEEEEEEERAIIGPDGTPFDERQATEELLKQDTDISESKTEETEVELTDEEEAIKANLETDEPLSAEILDSIIPEWWNKEPFKSTGFVLEGFPRTGDEARYMSEMGLFPDSAIILAVEDTDVIARLLPPKLDKWRTKRDKREAKKAKKKEMSKKKRDALIQKRRDELVKEREEKLAEKKAQQAEHDSETGSDFDEEEVEEEEEEEEDNIEAVLAEEFEEEEAEDEEEEELEEDAMDRLKNDLEEYYDIDTNKLAAVQETLDELLIPRVEIEGGRKPHIVRYTLSKRLKPLIEYRNSIFERVYSVSERLAKKMLQYGYKQPSCFGKWCPVMLKEGDCMQPMSGPGYSTYPCIYRQHIYFLSSPQARENFMLDPLTYMNQPHPKPVVPIRMAIVGPPKSGKTALAMRFADEYGLLRLSAGEAMRIVLEKQSNSELSKLMIEHLKKGRVVPDELAVQALEVCLLDMKSQTRGYILDGYPQTMRQVELMTERSIIPVRVIELSVDNKEVMVRGTMDRNSTDRIFPLHDSAKILLSKLQSYKSQVTEIREWYEKEHMNYKLVDGERSKWQVWNCALHVGKQSVKQIQTYLQKTQESKAAPIANLCVTPNEFLVRMGDFGQYCPVSLAKGELTDCSTNPTLEFAAEFRGHYYKMASQKELDIFLAEPKKYVPPLAPRQLPPPELLPKRRYIEDIGSTPYELQGYCPVTFLAGKCRYEAIISGSDDNIVEYRDKLYCLESEEKLNTFMRLPERYWNLSLPHKLPPKRVELVTTNLPMLGYLEQTTARLLTKALTAVGCFKPKYPFLSTSRSALLYVAFYLKAFNPNNSDYVRKKYRQKLMRFEDTCNLISYLGDTMSVRYKEPTERPQDFDSKLETFFALRGIEPAHTWVV